MKTVSVHTMRELDRQTIEDHEVPGSVLMDRAGAGLARAIQKLLVATGAEPEV